MSLYQATKKIAFFTLHPGKQNAFKLHKVTCNYLEKLMAAYYNIYDNSISMDKLHIKTILVSFMIIFIILLSTCPDNFLFFQLL